MYIVGLYLGGLFLYIIGLCLGSFFVDIIGFCVGSLCTLLCCIVAVCFHTLFGYISSVCVGKIRLLWVFFKLLLNLGKIHKTFQNTSIILFD